MSNGNLKDYLRQHPDIPSSRRIRWAMQAAEAVQLLHSQGYLHCDIKPSDYLLDEHLDLRIIDFAFSSSIEKQSWSAEPPRYYLSRPLYQHAPIQSDVFALGCTIYHIMTGKVPLEEVASSKVELLYRTRQFPDLCGVPHGEIILQCLLCQVASAQQVYAYFQANIQDSPC